jgi:hypothetical protein
MRTGHPEHFGNAVRERRQYLNLTLDGVKAAGGPTGPTVVRTEAGELEDPRPSTLAKFDDALQWQPGSAAKVFWDGAQPRARAAPSRALDPGVATVALPLEFVLDLMSTHRQLNDLADAASGHGQLQAVRTSFNGQISALVGMFVTDLLERNAGHEDGLAHPLLEYAFGELLSGDVFDHDGEVSEERLYRRWLMGKATTLSPAVTRKFRLRLAERRAGGSDGGAV